MHLYPQATLNSDSTQRSSSMSDCKNKQPQQSSKPDVEPIPKARTSTLSSLSNLPPLIGINHPMKQPAESHPGISQSNDMHQIKAMIDIGLGMYAPNLTFRKHIFVGFNFQWHNLTLFFNGLQYNYISSIRWTQKKCINFKLYFIIIIVVVAAVAIVVVVVVVAVEEYLCATKTAKNNRLFLMYLMYSKENCKEK
jgi:hypothetical protein